MGYDISSSGVAIFDDHATQKELNEFASKHRDVVTELEMKCEYGMGYEKLDFQAIGCLPILKQISLRCVNVKGLNFTASNTPALESIDVSNLLEEVEFNLALPELRSFSAEHTAVGDKPNAFGLSVSRCPKLQSIYTYKFRFLYGKNFAFLPSCASISLYRSECTDSLEILYAPKLKGLDLQAAYNLSHVRLWDLPLVTVDDVERLASRETEITELVTKEANVEIKAWRNGTGGRDGKRAYELNWIEEEEIDTFSIADNETMEYILDEYVEELTDEKFKMLMAREWADFTDDLRNRGQGDDRTSQQQQRPSSAKKQKLAKLPKCVVTKTNMELDAETMAHLKRNSRVKIVDESPDNEGGGGGCAQQ